MAWSFIVCDLVGNAIGQPEATGRSYSPGISTTETAAFTVRAGSPLWDQLQAGATTLKVYDSFQTLRFWGDVITDMIQGTGQGGSVQFTAADLSFRLGQRFIGKDITGVGLSYAGQDARAIAFDLLQRANAEAATGIVPGVGNVGLSGSSFTPVAGTFGKTTVGSAQTAVLGDLLQGGATGALNKQVSKFTLGERATVSSVVMDLQAAPNATLATDMRAVIYADNAGLPGAKMAESATQNLNSASYTTEQWVTFPLSATLDAGSYWVGYIAGDASGQFVIGYDGGVARARQNDTFADGASDPFGTVAALDSTTLAVYVNYMTAAPTTTALFVGPTVTYLWRKLLDVLGELGAVANSYEWKLRYDDGAPPTVYLDLVSEVGTDRTSTVFFEYGTGLNNCGGFVQTRSIQSRATHVYALSSASTLVAEAYDVAAETPPNPRAEDVLTVGDVTDTTLLSSLATQHVAIRRHPRKVVTVTLFPQKAARFGQWEIGDYVTVRASVADTSIVNGAARVWGATINIDELGNENAQPTLEPTL